MMRLVEWWNAMRKGGRETAIHNSFTTSPSGTAPSQAKSYLGIGRDWLDDPDMPEATVVRLQPYSKSSNKPKPKLQGRGFTCQKNLIKLAAPRGISSPFIGTELFVGRLADWLCVLRSVTQ